MPPELLAIGRVLRPHGVRGELLLETHTAFPAHLAEVETMYVGTPEASQPHTVRRFRVHGTGLLIHFADCHDHEAAETYRGQWVFIHATEAAPLPPGHYYQHQVIGLNVVTEDGEALGTVAEILETGANDVYVVRNEISEILLPAISSVIKHIDLVAKQVTVHLLEGLR